MSSVAQKQVMTLEVERPRPSLTDSDRLFWVALRERFARWASVLVVVKPETVVRWGWQLCRATCGATDGPRIQRFVGSVRRELLDHVVVLGQWHMTALMRNYLRYYHADRCHTFLDGDAPEGREVTPRPSRRDRVVARPRVGGLHHRYAWQRAA